jgi:cation transport regulator ChaC
MGTIRSALEGVQYRVKEKQIEILNKRETLEDLEVNTWVIIN